MENTIHDAVKPLTFLIGKWASISAKGEYQPRIEPFTYSEELEFTSVGQPMLNYKSVSWNPNSGKAMHLESGFLKIKPGTSEVAFIVAHNFGMTSIEEGCVNEGKVIMKGNKICRAEFNKEPAVTEISREFQLKDDGKLEMFLSMATTITTEVTKHLVVVYQKING